ncbi:uncharacterized protein BKCO1_6100011 [Diplodia corticola]|uniref:Uncharacterized protein n=1 Tax=Diplodia corticola TaxID=236234 RepID=A0A1J9QNA1_9PEZI|nr:uncharacterized protein BKCO1_6100011 [Diplodia corticola]OJD30374.1 hypothetical protein BKCO1_6100011 [Diplodia corticola]
MRFPTLLVAFPFLGLAVADTLQVRVWPDGQKTCSGASRQTITVGTVGHCYDTAEQFNSLKTQNVASSFFNRGLHVYVYQNKGCSGNVGGPIDLTNDDVCRRWEGRSFKVDTKA